MTELAVFFDNNVKSMSLIKVVLMSARNNQPLHNIQLVKCYNESVDTLADGGAPHP